MRASIIWALVALAGCRAGGAGEDAGQSVPWAEARALLTQGVEGDQFTAQAAFALLETGEHSRLATLLGFELEPDVDVDECIFTDGTQELEQAASTAISAELLDAGRLTLEGPTGSAPLVALRYPELGAGVVGVLYGADAAQPLQWRGKTTIRLTGDGTDEIGAIRAEVTAPAAFPGLQPPRHQRGSDLELHWSGAAGTKEPIEVIIAWSSHAGAQAVRCRAVDDGSFAVPHGLLASLPPAGPGVSVEVALARTSYARFAVPGLGWGRFVLALRDLLPLHQDEENGRR